MHRENLYLAILAACPSPEDAEKLTNILVAFADVLRGPAPTVASVEMVADDTPQLILAEMRGLRADLGAVTEGGHAMRTAPA